MAIVSSWGSEKIKGLSVSKRLWLLLISFVLAMMGLLAVCLWSVRFMPYGGELVATKDFVGSVDKDLASYVQQAKAGDEKDRVLLILALTGLIAVSSVLLLGRFIVKSITGSLSELKEVFESVARGDLDTFATHEERKDELGQIAKTAHAFMDQTRLMARMKEEREGCEKTKAALIHELKTPLSSVRGAIGLVLGTMKDRLTEEGVYLLTVAQNDCQRLLILMNDLLKVDQSAAMKASLSMRLEDLEMLLNAAVEQNLPCIRKYRAVLECDPLEKAMTIKVDRIRFLEVLSNFLSNAAKYSPAGGVIRLSVERKSDYVRIKVKDHGLGIPENQRPKIFTKASAASPQDPRRKGGTGLGLHISKSLVELMGGRIGFETEEGFGSTFWAEFPIGSCEGNNIP